MPASLPHVKLFGATRPVSAIFIRQAPLCKILVESDRTQANCWQCSLPKVCFYFVGEDDLRDVRSAVANLAGRWKDLGISLGILPSDLDAIPSPNTPSPSDCLREMLVLWLKQNYKVRTTPMHVVFPFLLPYGLGTRLHPHATS